MSAPTLEQFAHAAHGVPMPVNTHVHLPPNFSAFGTAAEAVELAAVQGVAVLGASNYYDFSVYADLAERCAERGVYPLFGLEAFCYLPELRDAGVLVNDPGNPGKMYLCGKGLAHLDPMPAAAVERLGVVREVDGARIAAQVERLAQLFADAGLPVWVAVADVVAAVAERAGVPARTVHLQERHVAQAFAEALAAAVGQAGLGEAVERLTGVWPTQLDPVSVQNHLRSTLLKAGRPAYVPEADTVTFDMVCALVRDLGGFPCYPVLADGASPVCGFESSVADLAAWLVANDVPAAELIPNRNAPQVLVDYVEGLRGAGLVVMAGTEHNTLDMVGVEPVCADGSPLPERVRAGVWEGACVAAAHAHAVGRGLPGFEADTDPDRISSWAARGARLIAERATVRAEQGDSR